jgi:hypothetical protein
MAVGSVSAVTSTVTLSTDPRDLNGDGKVTAAEIQAYAARQAQAKKPEANEATKATEIKAQETPPALTTGRIDLYA